MNAAQLARDPSDAVSEVPQLTFGFWYIKVLATTLYETGGPQRATVRTTATG